MTCTDLLRYYTGQVVSSQGIEVTVKHVQTYPHLARFDIRTPNGTLYENVEMGRDDTWSVDEYDPINGISYRATVLTGYIRGTDMSVKVQICYEILPTVFFGDIYVNSEPSGASIYIDGTDIAKVTPATVNVSEGLHVVTLKYDKHDDYVTEVNVVKNKTVNVIGKLIFNPQTKCYKEKQISVGGSYLDAFNGKIVLDSVINTTTAVITITTPWGKIIPSVTINQMQTYEYTKDYLKYQVKITLVSTLAGGVINVSTCYLDATPPCIPNWQCRQPLDGYETDLNNCEDDRYNVNCEPGIEPPEEKASPLILLGVTAVAAYAVYMLSKQ